MKKSLLLMMSLGVFAAMTSTASADNITCANADFLPFGQLRSDSVNDTNNVVWYRVKIYEDRSYSFLSWAPTATGGDEVAAVSLSVSLFSDDCTTSLPTFTSGTADREGNPDATGHNGAYTGVILGDDACGTPGTVNACTARVRITASSLGVGDSMTVHTLANDTTLQAPYWQVTAQYDAAPQLRAHTQISSNFLRFIAYDAAGTKVCTVDNLPGTNGLATFSIKSSCSIPVGFGTGVVLHVGPPGTASGNITTFSAASGLSFDAAFTPRQQWGNY